ncbi:mechanosensitive ion channel family protein [Glaciecola sp. SC05]|uniref:mechanosensitive ion channel family protein n=1 Tax=Glaciecola sp. SC05 TaxID=1987355 RepID=UPI0035272396
MNETRAQFRELLLEWFTQHLPGNPFLWYDAVVLVWISISAVLLHFLVRGFFKQVLNKRYGEGSNAQTPSRTSLLRLKLATRVSFMIQALIVQLQAKLWVPDGVIFLRVIEVMTDQWIILFALLSLFTLLDIFQAISDKRSSKASFPLRGLLQTIKLVASVLTVILATAMLMNKSPLILFSGLGALSAVLLLVFRDAILGLVAGIQLSANNMLAVGDWLEMPKYGADGEVIDIALTTVKVRNWDKTITTIPTYALISDSFKNWRGMAEAGGRRIKRSVHIEMSSISFLSHEQLNRLKKADLLSQYITDKVSVIEKDNSEKKADMSITLNGRRLTNIGTFRHYLLALLKQHPSIHQGMTLMVRQLEPGSQGLPVQIYAFTNTTDWGQYEGIQSDIFDHILAILPEFNLRAHEAPSGNDVRMLRLPQ